MEATFFIIAFLLVCTSYLQLMAYGGLRARVNEQEEINKQHRDRIAYLEEEIRWKI